MWSLLLILDEFLDLVVQFIMLYKMVLTLKSVGEILKCDRSIESYRAVLSSDAVYDALEGGFIF